MSLSRPDPDSRSSPIKRSIQSSLMHQSSPESSAKETQLTMEKETRGHWVGPMPVAEFLNEFIPIHQETPQPPSLPDLFSTLLETKIENKLYDPFIKLVSEDHNIIPGFKIVNTSNNPDINSRRGKKIKPDPTMYKDDVDTTENMTRFDKLELHFEFKPKGSADPFHDPKPDISPEERLTWKFESDAQSAQHSRGQLASYATEWCTRQHRTFAFSVFIFDPYVRFIRWDRSGIIVTERFNFRIDSQPFVNFLWRFVHLTDVERGKDDTVREATADEVQLAHKHLEKWKNDRERPVVVFYIQDGDVRREFIGWGAMADAESLLGRATRAYPVYEKLSGEIGFLKDTWRAASLEPESQTLRILNLAKVRNVPALDCGGDIENHVTRSHIFGGEDIPKSNEAGAKTLGRHQWRCGKQKIVKRMHHRFTTKFVGVHLCNFTSSKQMMQAVLDAFIGHQDAYELCSILHRDVSGKNVMMTPDGRGILNDWDLAKKVIVHPHVETPRRHERTGTWQFISTLLLRKPGKPHVVQDDIESFVHVVLYHSLRYLDHTAYRDLRYIMEKIFDDYFIGADGTYRGGLGKQSLFQKKSSILGEDFHFTNNRALTYCINFSIRAVGAWHDYDDPAVADPALDDAGLPSLGDPRSDKNFNSLDLRDHRQLAEVWKLALDRSVWPSDDKAIDRLPSKQGSSAGKRSNDEDYDEDPTPKKKKTKSRGSRCGTSGGSSSLRQSQTMDDA